MSQDKRVQRCAIYTRKSTEEGLELEYNSLHAQRDSCEAYIKSQAGEGWVLLKAVYDDGGFSGGSMERPALQSLLHDIDTGKIDVVVVYKVDRLTRSLADFAKIVDRFDKRSVSFVSVTQSFNTTNSMGRLTLNVLLSFAQFEREVAGERIRDKIAASRRKGMWMGGAVPTGYDVRDRKLYPNKEHAESIQYIFRRFLELRSIDKLRSELREMGIVSQRRASSTGRVRGGWPYSGGSLAHLLKNRAYVGEVLFKGEIYPGQHEAILDRAIFDQAQEILAQNRRRKLGLPRTRMRALLIGKIFDDSGHPMSPSSTQKDSRHCYRYYVSRALIDKNRGSPGTNSRVPAHPVEDIVLDAIRKLLPRDTSQADPTDVHVPIPNAVVALRRVEIGISRMSIHLAAQVFSDHAKLPAGTMILELSQRLGESGTVAGDHEVITLTIPIRIRHRHGSQIITAPGLGTVTAFARPDQALVKAVVRAHLWLNMILNGEVRSIEELARTVAQDKGYVRRVLRLAFLKPSITADLLDGKQPGHLSLTDLLEGELPLAWHAQSQQLEM